MGAALIFVVWATTLTISLLSTTAAVYRQTPYVNHSGQDQLHLVESRSPNQLHQTWTIYHDQRWQLGLHNKKAKGSYDVYARFRLKSQVDTAVH